MCIFFKIISNLDLKVKKTLKPAFTQRMTVRFVNGYLRTAITQHALKCLLICHSSHKPLATSQGSQNADTRLPLLPSCTS